MPHPLSHPHLFSVLCDLVLAINDSITDSFPHMLPFNMCTRAVDLPEAIYIFLTVCGRLRLACAESNGLQDMKEMGIGTIS